MAFTHTIRRAYLDRTGVPVTNDEAISADSENNFDANITGANQEIDWAVTRANLKALAFSSDKACHIYTNDVSGGTPDDDITVTANQVIVWTLASDTLANCPVSVDVTKLYVTVASGTAAFKVRALLDVTP